MVIVKLELKQHAGHLHFDILILETYFTPTKQKVFLVQGRFVKSKFLIKGQPFFNDFFV